MIFFPIDHDTGQEAETGIEETGIAGLIHETVIEDIEVMAGVCRLPNPNKCIILKSGALCNGGNFISEPNPNSGYFVARKISKQRYLHGFSYFCQMDYRYVRYLYGYQYLLKIDRLHKISASADTLLDRLRNISSPQIINVDVFIKIRHRLFCDRGHCFGIQSE